MKAGIVTITYFSATIKMVFTRTKYIKGGGTVIRKIDLSPMPKKSISDNI